MTKALFVDRDGVVNVEKNYLHKIEDFEFIDGIFDALNYAAQKGYIIIIVTNQSGIERGYYTENDYEKLTKWMVQEFAKNGVTVSKVYHCPHTEDSSCECRKPKPGMILKAQREFDINLKDSLLVGDKESDIDAGVNAQIGTTVLARSGHKIDEKRTKADFVVNSIADIPYILDRK